MSRLPILCLNNNKSVGAYDHLEFEIGNAAHSLNGNIDDYVTALNQQHAMQCQNQNQQLIRLNASSETDPVLYNLNKLHEVLELILHTNVKRSLDFKFKSLCVSGLLSLDWLKANEAYLSKLSSASAAAENKYFTDQSELILAWIYYAREVLVNSLVTTK